MGTTQPTLRELMVQVMGIGEIVTDLNHAVRGNNGSPGLVTRIETLATELEALKDFVELEFRHIRSEMEHTQVLPPAVILEKDKSDQSIVRWPYILEKFVAPVLTSAITAILILIIMRGSGLQP